MKKRRLRPLRPAARTAVLSSTLPMPVEQDLPGRGARSAPSGRGGVVALPSRLPGDDASDCYDDGLLERCRQAWQAGRWADLVQVAPEELDRHPERARLAMMRAAAHQGLGESGPTRTWSRLALQWGAEPTLLARVLFAGVHNTLGRAWSIAKDQPDRALRHFDAAVAPAAPRSRRPRVLARRLRSQLDGLPWPDRADRLLGRRGGDVALPAPAVPAPLKELGEALRHQADQMAQRFKEQNDQLWSVRKNLDGGFKRDLANAIRQLEAHASLQGYLQAGTLMPEFHGWPVSPDFACLLIQRVEQGCFDAVVEFGSGSSTVLMATALRRRAQREGTSRPRPYVVFEHLEEYRARTEAQLRAAGFSADEVLLLHAPLSQQTLRDGRTHAFYDCGAALDELRLRLPRQGRGDTLFVVVDGPPAATGPQARYPAVELLLDRLPDCGAEVVLDDYGRKDEQEIVQRWATLLGEQGHAVSLEEHPLEKGACTVTYARSAGGSS